MENNGIDFLRFGINSIDLQHQMFFEILNKLEKQCFVTNENRKILPILDEIENYTKCHFDEEKRIMERIGFQEMEAHVGQHNLFIEKFLELKQAYNYQSNMLGEQMLELCQKWLLNHIPEWDKQYVDFINNANIQLND